jgi:hypothetical protein
MTKRYLRFSDLKRIGVVGNWQTLKRWIEKGRLPGWNQGGQYVPLA